MGCQQMLARLALEVVPLSGGKGTHSPSTNACMSNSRRMLSLLGMSLMMVGCPAAVWWREGLLGVVLSMSCSTR